MTSISTSTPQSTATESQSSPRERLSLNENWRFQKDDPGDAGEQLEYANIKDWIAATGSELEQNSDAARQTRPTGNPGEGVSYVQSGFDDSGWRQLNLPHDWGIEGPFTQEYPGETGKLPWWGIGWYRKHFSVPAAEAGRQFYLDIDGAMSYSAVWLNGQFIGGWPYGYSSYRLDLTPYIKPGEDNVLAIRLDNPPDSSRWYPGGGIYRNVWLVKTSAIHVAHWGTYITTPQVDMASATVDIEINIANRTTADASVIVRTGIYQLGTDGRRIGEALATSPAVSATVAAGERESVAMTMKVSQPKLWSLQEPNRYVAVTTIEQDGQLADSYETIFGIRTIEFDVERGFLLNGEEVEIKGVCNHHDLGALGAAINVRALERQIEILQEMGCNAIRTSHNPPAPELLDLCDRMGMLVMDEAFDAWRDRKKPNDYHRLFDDWHEKDLRALVRRDRNHPCVILWSIGNEIIEQGKLEGRQTAEKLAAIVRGEDPTRPVTVGVNVVSAGYNGFQQTVDVFGYNYKPFEYEKFHKANPTIPLYGSETASTISSRGEYFFPVSDDKAAGRANFQMSSYDLYAPEWATTPDAEFEAQDRLAFVSGEFVWTGFDYLGEPTPYNADVTNLLNFSDPAQRARMEQELQELGKIAAPSRSSYFGIIDLCGFKKDRFSIYQAKWRPDLPMAHILPHWNWPERVGEVTPVHAYTSGDEAELFLNGQSLGRRKKQPYQYRLRWDDVKYAPGELKVVAYKDGEHWAENVAKTTGPATRILLQADRDTIKADGRDLSFVTVAITDEDGQVVPRSRNRVRFEIFGPGEIVAVDNGDATSHESFQSKERNVYNGLCLVIVRAQAGAPGQITLKAQSDGLHEAQSIIIGVPTL